jgi:hypothetical protein
MKMTWRDLVSFISLPSRRAAREDNRTTAPRRKPIAGIRSGEPAGNTGSRPKLKPDVPKAIERQTTERNNDDAEEMQGDSAIACARQRERERIKAILQSQEAAANPALAAGLAFHTRMGRREALALLQESPPSISAADASAARAARNPRVTGIGDWFNPEPVVAAAWDRAFEQAAGSPVARPLASEKQGLPGNQTVHADAVRNGRQSS